MSDQAANLTRPNGKPYRPRNVGVLTAHAWDNWALGWDERQGVVVLGTLDPERAQALADQMCEFWYGMSHAGDPQPGWWRDGFRNGERAWIDAPDRGQPGVMFTAEDQR